MQVKVYNLNDEFCEKERRKGNCYRFASLEELEMYGLKVEKKHYDLIWEGEVKDDCTLNKFYEALQWNKPAGWRGCSLSVSDVVIFKGVAYYCDSIGWSEVEWND